MFSCIDVEKKYDEFKINSDVQHYGAKRVEIKEDIYVYQYDGIKSYSDFGMKDQYQNEEELTFMVWINPNKFQSSPIIDNYSLLLWIGEPRKQVRFEYQYGEFDNNNKKIKKNFLVDSKTQYELDKWLHITAVYKRGAYLKIYLNGKLDTQIDNIKNEYGDNWLFSDFFVGKSKQANGKRFFSGMIDVEKIGIYNKEISQDDIKSYYNSTKKRYSAK